MVVPRIRQRRNSSGCPSAPFPARAGRGGGCGAAARAAESGGRTVAHTHRTVPHGGVPRREFRGRGASFLDDKIHMTLAMAGFTATVFVQLASMLGSPAGGWLADALRRRSAGGRLIVQA